MSPLDELRFDCEVKMATFCMMREVYADGKYKCTCVGTAEWTEEECLAYLGDGHV